ncbi:MAG TPA: hypothetical protein VLL52_20980 [Anaerolineae bacterium]|nr:hypothetical protein [Anaerolineae bacterium]
MNSLTSFLFLSTLAQQFNLDDPLQFAALVGAGIGVSLGFIAFPMANDSKVASRIFAGILFGMIGYALYATFTDGGTIRAMLGSNISDPRIGKEIIEAYLFMGIFGLSIGAIVGLFVGVGSALRGGFLGAILGAILGAATRWGMINWRIEVNDPIYYTTLVVVLTLILWAMGSNTQSVNQPKRKTPKGQW